MDAYWYDVIGWSLFLVGISLPVGFLGVWVVLSTRTNDWRDRRPPTLSPADHVTPRRT